MLYFTLKETGPTPGILKRALPRLNKAAWKAAGIFWHTEFRPLHFLRSATRRYGYLPRSGSRLPRGSKGFRRSYSGRKLRKYHHMKPLVFSGQSRDLTKIRNIKATSKGVRVSMNAPALNARPKDGRIRMHKELRKVIPAEREAIAEVLAKEFERQADRIRTTLVTEIR